MNWFRSHYTRIRNAIIGVIMVAVCVFIWHGIGKYQERRAREALYPAQVGQTASSAVSSDEVIVSGQAQSDSLPGQAESGDILPEEKQIGQSETGETEMAGEEAEGEDSLTLADQLYQSGLEQKSQLIHNDNGTVTWQGKTYRRNSYMKAILCIGLDRSDTMAGTRKFGEAGRADGIFLIAQDTARDQIRVLMIPRDTMTEMSQTNEQGEDTGRWINHLTLAFAYGDGNTESCERMAAAVSDVLCGLTIDHYLAVDTVVISELNDAVGGVTVTIPTEGMEKTDPAFIKGTRVTLHGSQAEAFVRYRDIERDNSAVFRMDQHREYIQQYFKTLQEKSRTDSGLVSRLFDRIQDYMLTDMDKAQYLKIAVSALDSNSLDDDAFYVLPGLGITTDTFDEFYVVYSQAIPVILQLFYRETAS
ncbi:MAG: LCP family protein [Clostridiales bacterium]|nr:LCP family protein [Clostridiales bacterium]